MKTFIKTTVVAIALLTLVGCHPAGYVETTGEFTVVPEALKDCGFYEIWSEGSYLRIVRCPNSTTSTTYSSGKSTVTTVVIDGVTYVKQDEL